MDLDSKLITEYRTTVSSTNDAKAAEGIFTEEDNVAYGDAAYPFMESPENVKSQICACPTKNHPLSEEQKEANHQKAKKRCRVEHVFAGMVQMVGGTSLRCKSLIRAEFNIALLNMIYNMRRLISLNALQKG